MFELLRKFLTTDTSERKVDSNDLIRENLKQKKFKVAAAALFVEIAEADGNFSEEEKRRIIELMEKEFNLDEECVEELLELSEKKVKESISVYEFTSIINEDFSQQEKLELLKNLWRIVYVDGKIDSHEDQLIKIIGTTMNIEHKDIIGAKLLVKQELRK